MGRRKLRFDVRKNCERKKKKQRDSEPVSLSVSLPISVYLSARVADILSLQRRLAACNCLPQGWAFGDDGSSQSMILYKLPTFGVFAGVAYTLLVDNEFMWKLKIGESIVRSELLELLKDCPVSFSCAEQVIQFLLKVDEATLCIGNADSKFAELVATRKGCFKDPSGTIVASFDSRPLPISTIRHFRCELLVSRISPRCMYCTQYRSNLHAMCSRAISAKPQTCENTAPSSHTNYRYLTTLEKHTRMKNLHHENRLLSLRLERLKLKMINAIEKKGVELSESLTTDLHKIMEEEEKQAMKDVKPGSFQELFWQQQKEAACRDKRGMRWHPAMIKWCLFLRHQSSQAYETLRQSGCLSLPSQRTLRDYSNCVDSSAGFSTAVDYQLMQAANISSCKPWEKFVVLLLDEMHIREDLVYSKKTGKLAGFSVLGNVNDHLLAFERSLSEEPTNEVDEVAKSMMVFMVRGLFTRLRFPYAQFPCCSLTGELLFNPFWEAVMRLERMELKVLGATFDGASVNRRLAKVHDLKGDMVYKLPNVYTKDERDIYLFSDVPHLMKTVRNCWLSKARSLWNNGFDISWGHLLSLYDRDAGKTSGLSIIPKLTYEHVHLTSFSKMRVDLATQVLSNSVSKALPLVVGQVTTETARFVAIFDQFFDALNVSNFRNGARKRKSFQHPYRSRDDERLKWFKETFLKFLDDWETSVTNREGFTKTEKNRMLLSKETLLGLKMTVHSFVDLMGYLFSLPEVNDNSLEFLSQNLCQDPLEGFFGCQRQRGGTSDNPSANEFFYNTAALRVVNSFCRGPTTGNCRGPGSSHHASNDRMLTPHDNTPLPRRKKKSVSKSMTL